MRKKRFGTFKIKKTVKVKQLSDEQIEVRKALCMASNLCFIDKTPFAEGEPVGIEVINNSSVRVHEKYVKGEQH